MFSKLPKTDSDCREWSTNDNRWLEVDASLFPDVTTNLLCFVLTVSVGRVSPLGADLAGVVADNEGADGESLALLVGSVVETSASLCASQFVLHSASCCYVCMKACVQ